MLQHQIEDMQSAVNRFLLRITPPAQVGILQEHADFLGVSYDRSRKPSTEESRAIQAAREAQVPKGKRYGPLVMVKLEALYSALRTAKGVNHPEYKAPDDQAGRSDSTQNADHGSESAPA